MTYNEMTFRELTIHDAVEVSRHVRFVCDNSPHLNHPNNDEWLSLEYSSEIVAAKIAHTYSVGVYRNNELIGTGFVDLETGLMSGIYVAHQGNGLGSTIIDRLLVRLRNVGLDHAEASVHPHSEAMLHLLTTKGFKFLSIDPNKDYFPDVEFRLMELNVRETIVSAVSS